MEQAEAVRAAHGATTFSVMALALALFRALSVEQRGAKQDDPRLYLDSVDALWSGAYESIPYPPGMAMVLTPAKWIGWPSSASWLVVVLTAALIAAVWWLSWRLGGPAAAGLAALTCAVSPMIWASGAIIMSDASGALLVVLGLIAASHERWRLSGLLMGLSALLRIGHVVFLAALPRRKALFAAAPIVGALLVFQLIAYESISGYSADAAQFSLKYIQDPLYEEYYAVHATQPNWIYLPAQLLGSGGRVVPFIPIFAGTALWRRRSDPVARMAALVVTLNVALYLPYHYQAQRFVLPAMVAMIPFATTAVVDLVRAIWSERRSRVERAAMAVDQTSR